MVESSSGSDSEFDGETNHNEKLPGLGGQIVPAATAGGASPKGGIYWHPFLPSYYAKGSQN